MRAPLPPCLVLRPKSVEHKHFRASIRRRGCPASKIFASGPGGCIADGMRTTLEEYAVVVPEGVPPTVCRCAARPAAAASRIV
jgi:hypothetical protein